MTRKLGVAASLAIVVTWSARAETRALDLRDPAWQLTGDAKIEELEGRTTLAVRTGFAYRRDLRFGDGTLEFDLYAPGERVFAYALFRMQSDTEYEEFYVRPHKSQLGDALQYSPVYQQRSNWKLYHDGASTGFATFPAPGWTHVRIVVKGAHAAFFIGEAKEPQMVSHLARPAQAGYLALRAFGNPAPRNPVRFANLKLSSETAFDFSGVKPAETPAGTITEWRVSPALTIPDGPVRALPSLPPAAAWKPLAAEPGGVVVLGKSIPLPAGSRRSAAAAALTLRAAKPGVKRLDLGFSDEATVFLNGQILFSGNERYSFNLPRRDGVITLDQASLYLPLREGDNELLVVVSEVFGGWGLIGRIEDREGLTIH